MQHKLTIPKNPKNLVTSFKKSRDTGFVNPENPGILSFEIFRLASLVRMYVLWVV